MRSHLKGLRKLNNLSQEETAELLNISVSFLRKIESGHRNPTIKLAKEMADLFGCKTIDEIVQAS